MDGKAQAAFYAILTADQQAKYDSMLPGASAAQVAGWDPGASTLRRARVPRDSRRRLLADRIGHGPPSLVPIRGHGRQESQDCRPCTSQQ
jgi:hypothetical protein